MGCTSSSPKTKYEIEAVKGAKAQRAGGKGGGVRSANRPWEDFGAWYLQNGPGHQSRPSGDASAGDARDPLDSDNLRRCGRETAGNKRAVGTRGDPQALLGHLGFCHVSGRPQSALVVAFRVPGRPPLPSTRI